MAGVGVTSAADGSPLGKPPNENERILRIGIDVQANELITTAANDRAHLVFLDGSALTVGPNAQLTIDKFVYDPNTQKGDLAINATKGVFRLVGGKISKNNPITITTPSSTIGIRGGITILAVTQNQTAANFVFGNKMTVTGGGLTQTATRPGSQVITNFGGVPGAAALLKPGSLNALFGNLEGGNSNNNSADQTAQTSGFSSKNSGQPANAPTFNQNLPPNTNNNTLTNAVSNSNPASQPVGNTTPQNNPSPLQNTSPQNNNTTLTTTTTTTTTTTPTTTTTTTTPNNTPNSPTRTSQTLTGFAGGLVVIDRPVNPEDTDDPTRRVRPLRQGTVSITTDATSNLATGTLVLGVNGSHHPATATLQLGGAGNSTFVNDTNYAMINNPSRQSTLRIGDATYPITNPAPISALASLSNPSTCTCEFLSFGAWASSVPDPRPGHDGKTYTAVGTYVAGVPAVQLPTMGSATYNGFMAGFARSNGNINYVTGTFQNVWSFGSRSGVFTGNFDRQAYSGTTGATGGPGSTTFAGTFNGGNRSGTLNGAFFSSPTDAAAYQAGNFSIRGSGYRAGGVFAGQHP